jgi:hypothetical protein
VHNKHHESVGFEDDGRCSSKYRLWWPPTMICDSATIQFLQHLHEKFCTVSALVRWYLWHFRSNGLSLSILLCFTFHYQCAWARACAHTHTHTHTHPHEFPNELPIIQKIHYSEVMNVFCRSNFFFFLSLNLLIGWQLSIWNCCKPFFHCCATVSCCVSGDLL